MTTARTIGLYDGIEDLTFEWTKSDVAAITGTKLKPYEDPNQVVLTMKGYNEADISGILQEPSSQPDT